jgi:hypothetical protein
LLCRWAFDAVRLDAIELMILVGNVASEQVAATAGSLSIAQPALCRVRPDLQLLFRNTHFAST